MPTSQDINNQRELLQTYRNTLAIYIRQQAMAGSAQTPVSIVNGIRESRDKIRQIKKVLVEWGVAVEDHPDDSDTSALSSFTKTSNSIPMTGTNNINTGKESINIGVGNLPNANIHVGNRFDSTVFPYEFIEVCFFLRAQVNKVDIPVRRLFIFNDVDRDWPKQITYELVVSITGSIEQEEVLTQGSSELIKHVYLEKYDNKTNRYSIDDVMNGRIGWHDYYPVDTSFAQKYIVQIINSLGAQRWELVSPPSSLGRSKASFDVFIRKPGRDKWEFPGGELRFYIGQDNNSQGLTYSMKRSRMSIDTVNQSNQSFPSSKRYCTSCGNKLGVSSKFCSACGSRVA